MNKMRIVSGVLGCVSLLFIVVALIGLIRPSFFRNKTGAVPKRALLFFGGILAAMLTVIVAALIHPGQDGAGKAADHPAHDVAVDAASNPSAAAAPRLSLDLTPQQFRSKYNRSVSEAGGKDALAEIDLVHDTVYDGFQQSVGRNLELAGVVNKSDGTLRELVIHIGVDEPGVMLKSVATLVTIAAAVNPAATAEHDDTKTIVNMIQLSMEGRKESKVIERSVGKLHYSAVSNETDGLLFSINPR
ncbi:hypothetical protein [Burkholderia arboris]|uniref:hypothetical protein n=1 Tax=Burkholderia arboris TaxID=488730 RepID=UPI0021CC62E8|nr:hypothetical protein [Burkholderia arboris]